MKKILLEWQRNEKIDLIFIFKHTNANLLWASRQTTLKAAKMRIMPSSSNFQQINDTLWKLFSRQRCNFSAHVGLFIREGINKGDLIFFCVQTQTWHIRKIADNSSPIVSSSKNHPFNLDIREWVILMIDIQKTSGT